MSAQTNVKFSQKTNVELPYCSDPDCESCKNLREMQEQVSRREEEARYDENSR